jgi:hypothetical protein
VPSPEKSERIKDVLAIGGGVALLAFAFNLGKASAPDQGCCEQLLRRDIETIRDQQPINQRRR